MARLNDRRVTVNSDKRKVYFLNKGLRGLYGRCILFPKSGTQKSKQTVLEINFKPFYL